MAIVVLAVQAASVTVSTAGLMLTGGMGHAGCCCSRGDSAGLCPLASSAGRLTARCGCGCQDRDTLPPSGPDPLAILSDSSLAVADLAAGGAPVVTGPPFSEFTQAPPSPPPWRTAIHALSEMCRELRHP